MVCVIVLLLLVPGMVTWKIAGERELVDWKDTGRAVVNWLVHDLVIACLVYAAFYVMKGAVTVSFSTDYLGEEVYYSIYDISFVFRYSALALLAAAGLGVAERLVGKLLRNAGKRAA
ncbi:MAG: hypothetical protein K2K90_12035 [Lachnospiraceae bacterium]|nr:hypothetical protein [Lachnospiraceae bacterium]